MLLHFAVQDSSQMVQNEDVNKMQNARHTTKSFWQL